MDSPLNVIYCFSLATFNNIFSLGLIFVSLIDVSWNVSPWTYPREYGTYGTLWACWTQMALSYPMLGKFLTIVSSNIFSYPGFFSSSSKSPIIKILLSIMLSQGYLRLPHVFTFCFLYSALLKICPPFYLPAHLFSLLPQLLCSWFTLAQFFF